MQKITPFFWFDTQAEEATEFYVSVFPNSKIGDSLRHDAASAQASGMKEGMVLTVSFTLDGQEFGALNGGPLFKFSEAISFVINCETQEEIDHYWDKLVAGGTESQCGWLKDKFGVSWQVVPGVLTRYLSDPDKAKALRVMQEMLQMKKIVIADLVKAYEG